MVSQVFEAKTSDEEVFFDRFVKVKVSKSFYKSKKPCFISKEPNMGLLFTRQILSKLSEYAWESPIAYLIPRSHDYQSYGDAYLDAADELSLDLKFWRYVHWPEDIKSKTLK